MAGRRRGRYTRGPKRRYLWVDNSLATLTNISAGAQGVVDLLGSIDVDTQVGMTCVRLLLNMVVGPDTSGQTVEGEHAVCIITSDAMAAGAVPDPSTDEYPWYLKDGFLHVGDADAGPRTWEHKYDIRTSRRIKSTDDRLLHIIENSGSSILEYWMSWRALMALA